MKLWSLKFESKASNIKVSFGSQVCATLNGIVFGPMWSGNSFNYASINVKPKGGGTPGICGAFDFSEEFLVKIPIVGPQHLVKSDQISPP